MDDYQFEPGIEFARQLDGTDELASYQDEFVISEPDLIYLDGNSLGRQPHRSADRVASAVNDGWGRQLIRGWNENWFHVASRIGDKIGGLVGAASGQVIVSDTTSINLFKLIIPALQVQHGRNRIISDELNFPSDLYILQGCIHLLGSRHELHLIPSDDGISIDLDKLKEFIDDDTALVTLSQVTFKSGFLYDVQEITEVAHDAGALVLWDLSHAVGAVPIELDKWYVDLAVGCTYKYLNGGPGSPAFLYIRRDIQDELINPIWGWFGQHKPFDFELKYSPSEGINHFQVSSPAILSSLAMEASVELVIEAGIDKIRSKSIQQTTYLIDLFSAILLPLGFTLGTPRNPNQRGSHISIRHPDGYRINRALIGEMNVIPDFREPDNIRLGLAPMYTTYCELWEAVDRIRKVIEGNIHHKYPETRLTVT
jgi:kynureninase